MCMGSNPVAAPNFVAAPHIKPGELHGEDSFSRAFRIQTGAVNPGVAAGGAALTAPFTIGRTDPRLTTTQRAKIDAQSAAAPSVASGVQYLQ